MPETKRIEVGFVGQQVITLKVSETDLERLRKGLSDGGWQTVATDDGEVDIDLAKVAFVRVAAGDHSVGFRN
ncbi:MAG TPA: hypothetical protein VKA36_01810 [Solirubrobacterales bacterium]|nr:hypothetical protein [Solirubrobacterales bacterium]